jgi:hypothetical protein
MGQHDAFRLARAPAGENHRGNVIHGPSCVPQSQRPTGRQPGHEGHRSLAKGAESRGHVLQQHRSRGWRQPGPFQEGTRTEDRLQSALTNGRIHRLAPRAEVEVDGRLSREQNAEVGQRRPRCGRQHYPDHGFGSRVPPQPARQQDRSDQTAAEAQLPSRGIRDAEPPPVPFRGREEPSFEPISWTETQAGRFSTQLEDRLPDLSRSHRRRQWAPETDRDRDSQPGRALHQVTVPIAPPSAAKTVQIDRRDGGPGRLSHRFPAGPKRQHVAGRRDVAFGK